MDHYALTFVWAFASCLLLYSFIARLFKYRHNAVEAERLGCRPPFQIPNRYPFGLDQLLGFMAAGREERFPDHMVERYAGSSDRTHGFRVLGNQVYMTAEPKNVQALLATQFQDFGLGRLRSKTLFPLLGNGIFTLDGKAWEHSRAMLRPQFARDQVSDLNLEEQHVQHMMRALPVGSDGWTSQLDLQVLFFRLTLDSACEFLLGESADSQLFNLPENLSVEHGTGGGKNLNDRPFADAFDNSQAWLATRSHFFSLYWMVNVPEFRRSNKIVHEFIDYFVDIALSKDLAGRQLEKGITNHEKDRYVFLEALAAQTRDPVELRSQVLNILLAGRDTTAGLLGWTFYTLARHPSVFQKLRATVIADFGSYGNDTSAITFSTLKDCQYLQHVLNEVLRLYPSVPINSRHALRDTTLPNGGGPDGQSPIFIPKGTEIHYSVYVMHRRKALWGEDADEFRPERWLRRKPGWEYLPFNGGPRVCLGQQFALTEASYVTVRLLQRFDGIQNLDFEPTKNHLTITSCTPGVKVRLHAAG